MTDIMQFFASNYVKADDLTEGKRTVTIDAFFVEEIEGKEKPAISFAPDSNTQPLILNKTNASSISSLYGRNPDDWIGKQVELYRDIANLNGRTVPCVRVRMP